MKSNDGRGFSAALLLLLPLLLAGCATFESLFERERDIRVEDLPAAVLEAARQEAPGLVVRKTEIEQARGTTRYEVEGTAGDRRYTLNITAAGRVVASRWQLVDRDDD